MNRSSRAFNSVVWGLLFAVILGIAAAYSWNRYAQASRSSGFPILGQVEPFSLLNQFAEPVTAADLEGGLWVANIIFTRCPGPCAQMSAQMSQLDRLLGPDWPGRLVSLTADPEHDTPAVLERYAEAFQARPGRWLLLTGDKEELYRVARQSLKLGVQENEEEDVPLEELFIHSTRFILVDSQGRVRQAFDGTEPDTAERVLAGIRALRKEEGTL